MSACWIRLADEIVQTRYIQKAQQLGVSLSVDAEGKVWFDDEEWCQVGDPHILALDDEFGRDWVAVHADEPGERSELIRLLSEHGIRFVAWRFGHVLGTRLPVASERLGVFLTACPRPPGRAYRG